MQRSVSVQRFYLIGLLVYLYSQVLDGPLRYLLDSIGVVFLIYTRDAILLIIMIHAVLAGRVGLRSNPVFIFLLCTLAIFNVVALVYVQDILQILFGNKTMLPLIAGAICSAAVISEKRLLHKNFRILFFLAASGVFLNTLLRFPWTGLNYELAGIEIQGGFERETSGFLRLQGFSRNNFEAGTQILLLWIFLNVNAQSIQRQALYWFCAASAIVLTTTKGIIAAFFGISALMLVFALSPALRKIKSLYLGSALAVAISLPFSLYELDIDYSDELDVTLFASLADRIENGWPPVIKNTLENGSIFTGRGVGGTGAGEFYFAPIVWGSPDNLFVFLFSWFGLFGVLMLIMLWWKSRTLQIDSTDGLVVYLWLLATCIYGISSSTIESPFFAAFLGFSLYYIYSSQSPVAVSRAEAEGVFLRRRIDDYS